MKQLDSPVETHVNLQLLLRDTINSMNSYAGRTGVESDLERVYCTYMISRNINTANAQYTELEKLGSPCSMRVRIWVVGQLT